MVSCPLVWCALFIVPTPNDQLSCSATKMLALSRNVIAFLTLLLPFCELEPGSFAGNLDPPEDQQLSSASSDENVRQTTDGVVNNQTDRSDDSVRVVYSSTESGKGKGEKERSPKHEGNGSNLTEDRGASDGPVDSADSNGDVGVGKPQQQTLKTQPQERKAQSVGFVPGPEEEKVEAEEVQETGTTGSKEKSIVRFVPNLPTRYKCSAAN